MNPQQLVAPVDSFGLPAPVWVFVLLLNLTLVLHFLAMGYVLATTLLHVFLAPAAREGSVAAWMLRRTEGPLPVALSFTITLGVAPLLFVQVLYQPTFYTANILIGYQWIGIFPILMAGFYLIYLLWGGRVLGRRVPGPLHLLGRLFIFCTMLYVMVTMTANALLAMNPESWPAVRESGGNFLLMHDRVLTPRLLHNFFAALIVGAVWWVALGVRSQRLETEPAGQAGAEHLRKIGGLTIGIGVMLQLIVGLWLIVFEHDAVQAMLMTLRPATALWYLALLGVMGLMTLGFMALAVRARWVVPALWGTLALILSGMFAVREAGRQARLAGYLDIHRDWTTHWQVSSLILFLVLFVIALGTIGLMLRWLMVDWNGNNTSHESHE